MPQYQVYFDTLEGEKKYNVDIGEVETLEEVLRDILVELAERGHVMRGISTGDLKVIWGGDKGKELDLSRSLPDQGVRPNEVLRVLVEIYEGGGSRVRESRIQKEWDLIQRCAALNKEFLIHIERASSPFEERFRVELQNCPGLASAERENIEVREEHSIDFVFPRFYPETPIECYTVDPLFHPNIRPETGFVCLWNEASLRDTVIQALARCQAMAAFRMVNMGSAHLMNPEAADWFLEFGEPGKLVPLSWSEIRVYDVRDGEIVWLEPGRSLSRRANHRLS